MTSLYFKNKDELLMAALDSAFHRFIRRAKAAMNELTDPREKLRRIAFLQLEGLGSNRNLAIVFQVELRQSVKFMERFSSTLLRDYLGQIRAAIEEGQRLGVFRHDLNATACRHATVDRLPIWSCSVRGLACHVCCQPRGGLLPHHFTLAAPLRTLAVSFCCTVCRLGSCDLLRPAVSRHPVLWCPDFPPARSQNPASGHPARFSSKRLQGEKDTELFWG